MAFSLSKTSGGTIIISYKDDNMLLSVCFIEAKKGQQENLSEMEKCRESLIRFKQVPLNVLSLLFRAIFLWLKNVNFLRRSQ